VVPNPIALRLASGGGLEGFAQRLADTWLWSDAPIGTGARPARLPKPSEASAPGDWRLVYDGPGLVDGRIERVVSKIAPGGERRVDFADGECYEIARDGALLRRVAGSLSLADSAARALGAPLALALALREILLLHASAVRVDGRALALVAPSGGGKSTFARRAAARGIPRLADDILPVRLDPPPAALPHFPQLKLAPEESYPDQAPEALPLAALIEIAHSPATRQISTTRFEPAAATFALVRATVAARLFDEQLLTRHFAACARAAETLPVLRLTYPSGIDHLDEVVDTLRQSILDGS